MSGNEWKEVRVKNWGWTGSPSTADRPPNYLFICLGLCIGTELARFRYYFTPHALAELAGKRTGFSPRLVWFVLGPVLRFLFSIPASVGGSTKRAPAAPFLRISLFNHVAQRLSMHSLAGKDFCCLFSLVVYSREQKREVWTKLACRHEGTGSTPPT